MSKQGNEASLISSSTILILSGIILGAAFNQFIHEGVLPYLIAAGVSGILSYVVFSLAASRRALEILQDERKHVEKRLDKHLFSLKHYEFALPPTEEADQSEFEEFVEFDESDKEESFNQLVASA